MLCVCFETDGHAFDDHHHYHHHSSHFQSPPRPGLRLRRATRNRCRRRSLSFFLRCRKAGRSARRSRSRCRGDGGAESTASAAARCAVAAGWIQPQLLSLQRTFWYVAVIGFVTAQSLACSISPPAFVCGCRCVHTHASLSLVRPSALQHMQQLPAHSASDRTTRRSAQRLTLRHFACTHHTSGLIPCPVHHHFYRCKQWRGRRRAGGRLCRFQLSEH